MNAKKFLFTLFIAVISSILAVVIYSNFVSEPNRVEIVQADPVPIKQASIPQATMQLPDLTQAAEKTVHAVVHVKTKSRGREYNSNNPFYEFFFGPGGGYQQEPSPVMGAGSGVILTSDGFIVTNNHVINGAIEIEVTLNDKRTFPATLVGADPTSDIALLKIEGDSFPFIPYGDSDRLKVGEWVLAVGNPFNLTSTVTAGIVSAKARSINIISNRNQSYGIESFIQTDAAVNPGNSGGALVNQSGELIGINTAIASRTGSYSGYSFAVPVSIAKKVVGDLMEYGTVQRGLLGVGIREVSPELAEELDVEIDKIEGVFVLSLSENGGAEEAGMQVGDIIVSVNGELVNSVPELQEQVGRHRPGEIVNLLVIRDGRKKTFDVTLRNIRGTTSIITSNSNDLTLGATLKELSDSDKRRLGLRSGVQVVELNEGSLKESGVKEGYIITKANRVAITSVDDFKRVVTEVKEGLFLTGVYPNGRVVYYAVNPQE